ncbi:unnamed protein product [Parnassius mnemosyne]|uniref:Transposase n=1 Tax=Parnassius mnemosyne TaxID=213953 RepID=A0AAV1LZM8_9NEOP
MTERKYSNPEYYEMVRCYILSKSIRGAQRLYESESLPRLQRQGINARIPNRNTILTVNQRLLEYGQFTTPSHASARGCHSSISADVENAVIEFFERNPRASTNDAAREFGVSQYYVWKLLNSSGYRPHHNKRVQAPDNIDAPTRKKFCEWLLSNIDNTNIMWTGEALFTRVGLHNSRNEHYWAECKPHDIKDYDDQVPLSSNVWAGIIGNIIVGPYFIERRLTGNNYLDMLQGVIYDFLDDLPLVLLNNFYFQHDGAPPHCSNAVRSYLNSEYEGRWIGRGGPIPWPARSQDLTPLHFYLWGEIKRRVYVEEAQSDEDLRSKIIAAFMEVKSAQTQLINVKNNLKKRAQLCIERNGLNFEHLLKYQ